MARKREAVPGAKFGRLTIRSVARKTITQRTGKTIAILYADCGCDCGGEASIWIANLGKFTNSCGCLIRETNTSHGLSSADQRLYRCWLNMVRRCDRPKLRAYKNYGGRGIRVCAEWTDNPLAFAAWAYANGYSANLTIDRIDTNGHYEPSNCRWVPMSEQSGNRRNRSVYTAWGETKPVSEWLLDERCIIKSKPRIRYRVFRCSWSPEKAMSTPVLGRHECRAHR